LKLTIKLNPISEIEISVMSQFILETSTHPPKIFRQTRVFGEKSKLGVFGPRNSEDHFWVDFWHLSVII